MRASAVEMHMDMSQEPFCVEIYRELAGHRWYQSDNMTRNTPLTPGHSALEGKVCGLGSLGA